MVLVWVVVCVCCRWWLICLDMILVCLLIRLVKFLLWFWVLLVSIVIGVFSVWVRLFICVCDCFISLWEWFSVVFNLLVRGCNLMGNLLFICLVLFFFILVMEWCMCRIGFRLICICRKMFVVIVVVKFRNIRLDVMVKFWIFWLVGLWFFVVSIRVRLFWFCRCIVWVIICSGLWFGFLDWVVSIVLGCVMVCLIRL